jgi:hypothetical protein
VPAFQCHVRARQSRLKGCGRHASLL